MSKLKTARAIRASFTIAGAILKWVGIVAGIGILVSLLWLWANAHFLSFAIVMGIVGGFFLLGGIVEAWDWSKKTIEAAEEEEREAQEQARADKRREELRASGSKAPRTPSFPFDDEDFRFPLHR